MATKHKFEEKYKATIGFEFSNFNVKINNKIIWLKDLKANACPDIKIFLVGNKADLEKERKIQKEKAENFKKNFDLDLFMETSAKTGMNSEELFAEAAMLLFNDYNKYKVIQSKLKGEQIKLEKSKEKKKKGCC